MWTVVDSEIICFRQGLASMKSSSPCGSPDIQNTHFSGQRAGILHRFREVTLE